MCICKCTNTPICIRIYYYVRLCQCCRLRMLIYRVGSLEASSNLYIEGSTVIEIQWYMYTSRIKYLNKYSVATLVSFYLVGFKYLYFFNSIVQALFNKHHTPTTTLGIVFSNKNFGKYVTFCYSVKYKFYWLQASCVPNTKLCIQVFF